MKARRFDVIRYDYTGRGTRRGSEPYPLLHELPTIMNAQVVIADPPYNQGVKYAGDPTGDMLPEVKYRELCASALRHHARWMVPGATCWWIVPQRHSGWLTDLMSAIIGPQIYHICWHETFSVYQTRDLTHDYRSILVHTNVPENSKLIKKRMDSIRVRSVRQEIGDKRADPRGRIPGTVWKIRRLQGTSTARVKWHKTQLPPELIQRIILGWSDPGDVVLDGFAGSGSAGVEALRLDRRFVGIDRSAVYVQNIRKRLEEIVNV